MYQDLDAVDIDQQIERERLRIEEARQRQREHDHVVAPMVDAKVKQWAADNPDRIVGGLRDGGILETGATGAYAMTSRGAMTAAELARYTVVSSDRSSDCVFGFCERHRTALSAGFQGGARKSSDQWCPGCMQDPRALATSMVLEQVAKEQRISAERSAKTQRIAKIKASRKNRITKTTMLAQERGVITEHQAQSLMAIWHEIQAP